MLLNLLQTNLIFFLLIIFVLFLPGYVLLLAIFGKSQTLSHLEKFIFSFGLGIISVDFIFFIYSKLNISITRLSSLVGIAIFILIGFLIYKLRNKFKPSEESNLISEKNSLFSFSKNQIALILLLLFSTIFIKTVYLSGTILPSATDLGHHMYWSKLMSESGQLPTYENMPDFIIGEQIIFGLFNLIGNLDFFSAFPPLLLLLIDLLGILTVFVLVLRVFKEKNVAILTLLFLGVLYAVSSPQAKFVSGGVVGNILGNFFVPLAFYFYYRAFEFFQEEKQIPTKLSRIFLSLAIFTTFGLFYTHHLTAFIFLFIFFFLVIFFLILNIQNLKEIIQKTCRLVFSPQVISVLILCFVFFFFIFTPNYVKTNAVETTVGAPSKETRAGLSISNLRNSLGEARLALGFLGVLILALNYKRKILGYGIIAVWFIMLFIMSYKPDWLFINLPSSRIGNYLSYPLSILSAYSLFMIFKKFNISLSGKLIKSSFVLILVFIFVGGLKDSVDFFKEKIESEKLLQTFDASKYLAQRTTIDDIIVKDHVYLTGDSWIKLFFMRGYKYPQSRGYLKRYEDTTKPREMCTLYMISNPGNEDAKKCFAETKTNFIMVDPKFDSAQFRKLNNFNQVYLSEDLAIYYRKI